jgi:hypothetical protein
MNAKELFVQVDGDYKSAGVWYCSKCRYTARTADEAERCCGPKLCDVCGKEIEKDRPYRAWCASCAKKNEDAKEKARFDKARKVTLAEYENDVVTLGNGDDYIDLDELATGEHGTPEYVYGVRTDAIKMREIDEETLYSGNLSDGFELSDLPGFDELLDSINKKIRDWNAMPNRSYEEDTTVVVLIPPDFYEEDE